MAATAYDLPLPILRGFAREFYGFCKAGELRFQRCLDCGAWRHVPRDMCAHCGSFAVEWARSKGRGRVFSWTTAWQPMMPAFGRHVPYSPVIVELDEGPRLVSWIVDLRPEELRLDLPVELVFEDVTPEVTLPLFRSTA